MIKVENITKSYKHLEVLKGVNLHIKKGEIISIVGASGAGKTTLLQIIGTLIKPDTGTILINNQEINHLKNRQLAKFRNLKIGFVFQFHNLLPEFTALENVCIPALIGKTSKKEAEEHAQEILHFIGLSNRIHYKPYQLSGGEQQRVAVARALMNNPDVILADEPSGNLDYNSQQDLYKFFFQLREKYHQTFLIATHDKQLASISDRKITMKDGLIYDE